MNREGYFLGLDMGTSSVGWAVTDHEYKLLRAKGKDMWGIREFEEAKTAVARRTNRISRRRRQREVARIGYVRNCFDKAIREVDPSFFERLENSKYFLEDKDEEVRFKSVIFNDKNYSDKDYFKAYPTVFHLREALIDNTAPHDVRFVYLAVISMFKHRGHFLNEGLNEEVDMTSMNSSWERFVQLATEFFGIHIEESVTADRVKSILGDSSKSRKKKKEDMAECLQIENMNKENKETVKTLLDCLCGLKVKGKKIFADLEAEDEKSLEINFSLEDYDDKIDEIRGAFGEERYELIEVMKSLYDISMFVEIMGDYQYLSKARVASYEKHKKDLKKLKHVIATYCTKDDYDKMFRDVEAVTEGSYSAYVKSFNSHNKKDRRVGKGEQRKQENLYKKIRTLLNKADENDSEVKEILSDIEKGTFLPKQLTSNNGVIPNQAHKKELVKILENAEQYLSFLREKDESGLTVSQRIVSLFSFHMPYYIGTVAPQKTDKWAIRRENGPVYPWNLEQKIDIEKTSEEFIRNLIRECTYMTGKKVMPKSSLLYEKYCVLNEINNIKIRNEAIDVSLKQEIFTELYERGKKVTPKQLLEFIRTKDHTVTDSDISGLDMKNDINNYLSSYGKFAEVFGADNMKRDSYKKLAEQIIFDGTIYGDDKKRFREILNKKYADKLDPDQRKRISGFKFKDWAQFSREFLEMEGCDIRTGEVCSLLQTMWETNKNMMELIYSNEYTFREVLEEQKKSINKSLCEFTAEDLDDYYFSAPVKRMIWQTLQVIKEVKSVKGSAPDTIFVEMTRSNDEKKGDAGRKESRAKLLSTLYKSIHDDMHDWQELIQQENASGRLKSKKMYLYIKQMGRDMYTGEPIDLDKLFMDNIYDIDHIYPRQFVKDDNLENNLVLVNKPANSNKTNEFPLSPEIRNNPKVLNLWNTLHKNKLMNDEKYFRLTRKNAFTEEEQLQFVARQIVETSQGTKGVTDLLKQMLPDTKIVYSKAGNVTEFRQKFDLLKCRSVNEFHHAHDAYLNIVVGHVYDTKFTQNPRNFFENEYRKDAEKNKYHLSKMFESNVERSGEIAWTAPQKDKETKALTETGSIITVKRMLQKGTPLMTRMNFEQKGELTKATLYSADEVKEETYIPLKSSDTKMKDMKKYGGFTGAKNAYFFLVEHDIQKGKKTERVRTIETVPLYKKTEVEASDEGLLKYCTEDLQLINPSVRIKKIKYQSLLRINGYYVYLSAKTENRLLFYNATNFIVSKDAIKTIRKIDKEDRDSLEDNELIELYDEICKKHSESIFCKRPNPIYDKLKEGREKFVDLSITDKCYVMQQIVMGSHIGSISGIDLEKIGKTKASGTMKINKVISELTECTLINQSVTGLLENRINLLTV